MYGQLPGLQSLNDLVAKDKSSTPRGKKPSHRKKNSPPKPIGAVATPAPSKTLHSYFSVLPKLLQPQQQQDPVPPPKRQKKYNETTVSQGK
jgi:hypothetical protein